MGKGSSSADADWQLLRHSGTLRSERRCFPALNSSNTFMGFICFFSTRAACNFLWSFLSLKSLWERWIRRNLAEGGIGTSFFR